MYDYRGLSDPCRLNGREISRSKLRSPMHFVTHVPVSEISLKVEWNLSIGVTAQTT